MKYRIILLLVFVSHITVSFGQNETCEKLLAFYNAADKECYAERIQKDIEDFNAWFNSYYTPFINKEVDVERTPENFEKVAPFPPFYTISNKINILKERKVYMLAISFVDMDDFGGKDNIYDHIIVDSTRCITVACVDDDNYVKGLSDYGVPGQYVDLIDNLTESDLTGLWDLKEMNIKKNLVIYADYFGADAILSCNSGGVFKYYFFIKGNSIITYDVGQYPYKTKYNLVDINEWAHMLSTLEIKKLGRIKYEYEFNFRERNKYFPHDCEFLPPIYGDRRTGQTQPDEIRLCQ